MIFTKKRTLQQDEIEVIKMLEEVIRRRSYCISQAVFLDEITPDNLIIVAERIYTYIWGIRK